MAELALSPADGEVYTKLWGEAGAETGFLAAGGAVTFLGSSGLAKAKLGAIWSLAAITHKGKL